MRQIENKRTIHDPVQCYCDWDNPSGVQTNDGRLRWYLSPNAAGQWQSKRNMMAIEGDNKDLMRLYETIDLFCWAACFRWVCNLQRAVVGDHLGLVSLLAVSMI